MFLVSGTSLDATSDTRHEADMSNINAFPDASILHCVTEAISDATRWGRDCHEIVEWHLRTLGVNTKHMAETNHDFDLVCLADGRWICWIRSEGKKSVRICAHNN